LHFEPRIPEQWKGYSFKVNFRNAIVKVAVNHKETKVEVEGNQEVEVIINGASQFVKINIMKKFVSVILVLLSVLGVSAQEFQSPNGAFKMSFSLGNDGTPMYQLFLNNKEVIKKSKLGLELQKDKNPYLTILKL